MEKILTLQEKIKNFLYNKDFFPEFQLWDFNKKEFKPTKLNRMSSKFLDVLANSLMDVVGKKDLPEDIMVDYIAKSVIRAAKYAYFGNATYESEGPNSHAGGDDSIQEQFTCWVTNLDTDEYRNNRVYISVPSSREEKFEMWTDTYEFNLTNLLTWIKDSELYLIYYSFADGYHYLLSETDSIRVEVLTSIINYAKINTAQKDVPKLITEEYSTCNHSIYTKAIINDVVKKYLDKVYEASELQYIRMFEEYFKIYNDLHNLLQLKDVGQATMTDVDVDFNTEGFTIADVYKKIKDSIRAASSYSHYWNGDVVLASYNILNNKFNCLPSDIILGTYKPFDFGEILSVDDRSEFLRIIERFNERIDE